MTTEAVGAREVLVDSNVLLDVVTEDPHWFDWSSGQLDVPKTVGVATSASSGP